MDLAQIGNIHIFRLPIDISMLKTIRQQLWTSVDRSPDINNLMAIHLVQCKRIDRQPLTYLSALPHQLLKGNTPSTPYSSPQIFGNYLLESLATGNHNEPTTQWQGTVNEQGYLYLQPSDEVIITWLNQLLNIKNAGINSYSPSVPISASITLQYIYIRCHQLLRPTNAEILQLSTTESIALTTNGMELIGAILDVWDYVMTDISDHRTLFLSKHLIEQFLEFEKYCCMSTRSNQLSRNFNFGLITVVQKTAKIILHQYWGIEPPLHW